MVKNILQAQMVLFFKAAAVIFIYRIKNSISAAGVNPNRILSVIKPLFLFSPFTFFSINMLNS